VSGRCASEKIKDTEKLVHLSFQEEVLESIDTIETLVCGGLATQGQGPYTLAAAL